MKNILNQEIKKPVYLMNKEECIAAMVSGDDRAKDIAKHFYRVTGELISSYC